MAADPSVHSSFRVLAHLNVSRADSIPLHVFRSHGSVLPEACTPVWEGGAGGGLALLVKVHLHGLHRSMFTLQTMHNGQIIIQELQGRRFAAQPCKEPALANSSQLIVSHQTLIKILIGHFTKTTFITRSVERSVLQEQSSPLKLHFNSN